jgi:hypothetical protein
MDIVSRGGKTWILLAETEGSGVCCYRREDMDSVGRDGRMWIKLAGTGGHG